MADEFDCVECGRHIIALPYDVMGIKTCAACITVPGWWRDEAVARILDPEHDRAAEERRTPPQGGRDDG